MGAPFPDLVKLHARCHYALTNLRVSSGKSFPTSTSSDLMACQQALCRWILRADPEAGLEMFVQLEDGLPPSVALPILTAQVSIVSQSLHEFLTAWGAGQQDLTHSHLLELVKWLSLGACGDRTDAWLLRQPLATLLSCQI